MSPSACSSSLCARAHKENKVAGTSTRNHEIKLPATPCMRARTNAWRTCRAPVRPMHTLHSIALDEKGPSVRASNTCVCVSHVKHLCLHMSHSVYTCQTLVCTHVTRCVHMSHTRVYLLLFMSRGTSLSSQLMRTSTVFSRLRMMPSLMFLIVGTVLPAPICVRV